MSIIGIQGGNSLSLHYMAWTKLSGADFLMMTTYELEGTQQAIELSQDTQPSNKLPLATAVLSITFRTA